MFDTDTAWFPVITLVIGYALNWLTDLFKDLRTDKREEKIRETVRQDKRSNFQHQTLLELQEAIMDLTRKTSQMHFQDVMRYKHTGKWQKQLFEEELSEGFRLVTAQITMLSVRIRDDSVRQLANDIKRYAINAISSNSQEDSQHAMSKMSDCFEKLNNQVGELLRALEISA